MLNWLLVVARSRAIDRLRALRRRGHGRGIDPADCDLVAADDTEEQVAANQQRGAVRRLLTELPDEQRRALELAYYKGYTQSEIAEITQTPLGTVKTRLRQGLIKLRERLRSYSGSEESIEAR